MGWCMGERGRGAAHHMTRAHRCIKGVGGFCIDSEEEEAQERRQLGDAYRFRCVCVSSAHPHMGHACTTINALYSECRYLTPAPPFPLATSPRPTPPCRVVSQPGAHRRNRKWSLSRAHTHIHTHIHVHTSTQWRERERSSARVTLRTTCQCLALPLSSLAAAVGHLTCCVCARVYQHLSPSIPPPFSSFLLPSQESRRARLDVCAAEGQLYR